MKTHYYLGWFNNYFPKKIKSLLNEDIEERNLLVMVSANTSCCNKEVAGSSERSWLEEANILFEEYHVIDYDISQEEAQKLINKASVIFLLGGSTIEQNQLLESYDLMKSIKKSSAIVLGTSAGSINMSSKWLFSHLTGNQDSCLSIHKGIGFDSFSVLSHCDLEKNMESIQKDMSDILKDVDLFASNKDCAIRVKNGIMDIVGDVYLVTSKSIEKLQETVK